ncbi:MAG: Cbp1 family collagen-binding glycoprotein adhesin [Candidatus Hodarchaeales archaeon]|jgi:cell division protein FtsB
MRIATVLLIMLIFLGCADKEKIATLEEKNTQLEAEYNLLLKESTVKNNFIEEYTRTINEVYDNLEKIREREGFISKASQKIEKNESVSLREQMLSDISSIDSYLQSSKKSLRQLKARMKKSQVKMESLEKMVETLNNTIEEKEKHIAELKTQTEQLTIKIAEVEGQLHEKEELIEKQNQQLNTVFYIIGTEEELREKGIIEVKGGFLGFGKTKRISSSLNYDYFTRTNISNVDRIPIYINNPERVNIISPHNPGSYTLAPGGENETVLEIINPEEFWKSKYLVILYKS